MDRYKRGKLARAKAGHDAGKVYVILDCDGTYVWLADGRLRKSDRPKKKKRKHVQLIDRQYELKEADDAQLRQILREYGRSQTPEGAADAAPVKS